MVLCVVQARLGSNRFPRKMLEHLGDRTLIEWVLLRLNNCRKLSKIVLAVPATDKDSELHQIALDLGVPIWFGSEKNVLSRFVGVSGDYQDESIVRVCGDNPFIAPEEVDLLVDWFAASDCDYAFNHRPAFDFVAADGFGAEIFHKCLLDDIWRVVCEPDELEHVTLHIVRNRHRYKVGWPNPSEGLEYPSLRFDVDDPSDLDKLRVLVDRGIDLNSSAREIVKCALELDQQRGF